MDALVYLSLFSLLTNLALGTSPTASPSLIRSSQNNIKTYAGTGSSTSSGNGGLAINAGVVQPRTVIQDSAGLIYFNDGTAHCVRKVSATGIVSLFLGTCGTSGFGGDGGPASAALINWPVGMVFDTLGNFYLSDYVNYRVRYVSAGIVSTIAGTGATSTSGMGGAASSAGLYSPHGMWMSTTNSIYITLYQDAMVKVFTKGGSVQSVAGTGSAGYLNDNVPATSSQFSGPERVLGTTTGVLYIADSANHRVRMISTSSIVTTVAGWGDATYNGEGVRATSSSISYPCGVAIDTGNNDMYINSRAVNRLQVLTKTTGLVTTFAGTGTASTTGDGGAATSATMNANDGIYIETVSGQMYITEWVGNYIRLIYTVAPSIAPSQLPTVGPTVGPSVLPSIKPSVVPSILPSILPSVIPSVLPTTTTPTVHPSIVPTVSPSVVPTTITPTCRPSVGPTLGPSVLPSVLPTTASPTVQPSIVPTIWPSLQPTLHPSLQPTFIPTVKPTLTALPIRNSTSYSVVNGRAFAGITSDGGVMSWGSACCGGDSSSVSDKLKSGVLEVVQSKNAFAALKSDGSVVAWGLSIEIAGWSELSSTSSVVESLVGNEQAFAGVTSDGGVVAFGADCCGGNVDQYGWGSSVSSGVSSVRASAGAFCALKDDGSVYCWGSKFAGGGVSSVSRSDLSGIVLLSSTRSAFAGLTSEGSVVTWGNSEFGGSLSADVVSRLSMKTVHIASSHESFVAYTLSGELVAWGGYSGVAVGGFRYVASTATAFAGLRFNGSVSAFGDNDAGGDASSVATSVSSVSSVSSVVGNTGAFAAVTSVGGVVAWGGSGSGGSLHVNVSSAVGSGVSEIHRTSRAFAVVNGTGGVTAWGRTSAGGSIESSIASRLSSGVKLLCANDNGFTAIKEDGSAYIWGCGSCLSSSDGVLEGDYSSVVSC